jgi:hypothetical protein
MASFLDAWMLTLLRLQTFLCSKASMCSCSNTRASKVERECRSEVFQPNSHRALSAISGKHGSIGIGLKHFRLMFRSFPPRLLRSDCRRECSLIWSWWASDCNANKSNLPMLIGTPASCATRTSSACGTSLMSPLKSETWCCKSLIFVEGVRNALLGSKDEESLTKNAQ